MFSVMQDRGSLTEVALIDPALYCPDTYIQDIVTEQSALYEKNTKICLPEDYVYLVCILS